MRTCSDCDLCIKEGRPLLAQRPREKHTPRQPCEICGHRFCPHAVVLEVGA